MTPETIPGEATVDAVVLAGSINRIALFPGDEPGYKALVELNGQTLISYVLDSLHAARQIGRIIVVSAPPVLEYASRWPRVVGIPEAESLVDNAILGLEAAQTERVLYCNPDQPLLRTEMVDDFLTQALPKDADVVSSWVTFETLGRYSHGEHKFAEFSDGKYAHGNLFLARREFPGLEQFRQRMDALYQARKNNLQFAWALGLPLFTRFLVAKLMHHLPSLEHTLQIAGDDFGLKLAGVISPFPEIALDIDEPEDYAAAVEYLTEPAPPLAVSLAA